MAGWFNTQVPTGLEKVIANSSPLSAMSSAMSNLSDIVDNRVKEQYTTSALDSLKGITNTKDYLDAASRIDYTKLNKEGISALDRMKSNIAMAEEAKAREFTQGIQQGQFDIAKAQEADRQQALLKDQITNEVYSNWKSMTPEQQQQAMQYSGLDAIKFQNQLNQEAKAKLDASLTRAQIAKANAPTETQLYISAFDRLLKEGNLPEGVNSPMALKQYDEERFKVTKTTSTDDIKEMTAFGYPLTKEGFAQYINDKNSGNVTKRDSLSQAKVAIDDYNKALNEYNANPTSENKNKLDDARLVKTKITGGGQGEVREDLDKVDYSLVKDIAKKLINGDKVTEDRYSAELGFKGTKAYTSTLKNAEDKFIEDTHTLKSQERLYDKLKASIDKGEYKSGLIDSTLTTIGTVTPKGWRTTITGLDNQEIMNRMGLEGSMGGVIAEYLKELSGATATEQEFVRKVKETFGGGFMIQEDAKANMFDTFIQRRKDKVLDQGKKLIDRGLVGDVYDSYQSLISNKSTKTFDPMALKEGESGEDEQYFYRVVNGKLQRKAK